MRRHRVAQAGNADPIALQLIGTAPRERAPNRGTPHARRHGRKRSRNDAGVDEIHVHPERSRYVARGLEDRPRHGEPLPSAAATSISSEILWAFASSKPRKIPGKASTLLI